MSLNLYSARGQTVVDVNKLAQFPAPVSTVITLADNTFYKVHESIDFGSLTVVNGNNTRLGGHADSMVTLSGNAATPIFTSTATNSFKWDNLTFQHNEGGIISQHGDIANTIIQRCTFRGGTLNIVSGFSFFMQLCTIELGARIMQGANSGIGSTGMLLENCTLVDTDEETVNFLRGLLATGMAMKDLPLIGLAAGTQGIINFSNTSAVREVLITQGGTFLVNASDGIFIDSGAQIELINIFNNASIGFNPSSAMVTVQNPANVLAGYLKGNGYATAGDILRCEPISSSNFVTADTGIRDCASDGTNLIVINPSTNVVTRYTGFTSTILDSIATPASDGYGLTWMTTGLISSDITTDLIYFHDGFSTTITSSIASPDSDCQGLATDGYNLISADAVTNKIYVHDGQTATILFSFVVTAVVTAGGSIGGIAFDGLNLLITDTTNNTLIVLEGRTSTVLYTIDNLSEEANGIVTGDTNAVTSRGTGTVFLYDTSLVFCFASNTWNMQENPQISYSNAKITAVDDTGSSFEVVTLATINEWQDISSAAMIYFGCAGCEKFSLEDALTGKVKYNGFESLNFTISAAINVERLVGVDLSIEIGIFVGDFVIKNSITAALLGTNTPITLQTNLISVRLLTTNTVQLKMRNRVDTRDAGVAFSKMSVIASS